MCLESTDNSHPFLFTVLYLLSLPTSVYIFWWNGLLTDSVCPYMTCFNYSGNIYLWYIESGFQWIYWWSLAYFKWKHIRCVCCSMKEKGFSHLLPSPVGLVTLCIFCNKSRLDYRYSKAPYALPHLVLTSDNSVYSSTVFLIPYQYGNYISHICTELP